MQAMLCALVLLVALLPVDGAVLRYDVTSVRAADLAELPAGHWAQYDERVASEGIISDVSFYDDADMLSAINITAPFFNVDDVPWYVSSNGYLSPMPVSMCRFFCTEVSLSSMVGYLQFGEGIYGGGGDWPMIGLYVMDLAPHLSEYGSIRVLVLRDDPNATDASRAIAEYANVRPMDESYTGPLLTAQVELWRDGTIIMRYKSVISPPSSFELGPSVGLVLSKSMRKVVDTPSVMGEDRVVAYRFDPVMDHCTEFTEETACLEAVGGECGWCVATTKCIGVTLSNMSCPLKSFHVPSSTGAVESTNNEFYNVFVSYGVSPVDVEGLDKYNFSYVSTDVMKIQLNFDFPFFTVNQRSHKTNVIYMMSPGIISVFSDVQDCNPIWNVCPNGNYSFSISPFSTAAAWADLSMFFFAPLPERVAGDVLCDRPQCPSGCIIAVENMGTVVQSLRRISFQIYLDASGVVEVYYGEPNTDRWRRKYVDVMLTSYPPPLVGLFRYGADDPASIKVPFPVLRNFSRIRFEPLGLCNDCGLHGVCNKATMECICGEGFAGEFCGECAVGYYGPSCLPCTSCRNDGRCDDGIHGTGRCKCTGRYSGKDCSIICDTQLDCPNCNLQGGYCECGTCICDTEAGWGGPNCEETVDPCRPYSFDGCPTCGRHTNLNCTFCFDAVCYSKGLFDTPNRYTCSHSTPIEDTRLCAPFRQVTKVSGDFGLITLVVLCIAVVVCIVAIVAIVILVRRTRNVFDLHTAVAAGGMPDHRSGRREREVVQAIFIQENVNRDRQRHLMGIPLKQISLKKLYKKQCENRGDKKNS